jgi:hypothetical protein
MCRSGAPNDRDSIEPGKHPVEDRNVEPLDGKQVQCIEAIPCQDDVMAEFTQPSPDELGRIRIVFGDEDPHC